MEPTYKTNDLKALGETLEGETVVINFESGNYYSLNTTASHMWELLRAGCTEGQLVEGMRDKYEQFSETSAAAVKRTLKYLCDEQLVAEEAMSLSAPLAYRGPKQHFVPPSVEKYDDMREMLLADPIHDVDEIGWPKRKSLTAH